MELRLRMLAQGPTSLRRYLAGAVAIAAMSVAAGLVLWGFAPL